LIPRPRILFLTLDTFAHFGGIEKFNKNFLLALQEIGTQKSLRVRSLSMLDKEADPNWFSPAFYKGYSGNKLRFVSGALPAFRSTDILVLGHINLSPLGVLFKLLYPKRKMILVVHGYEAWNVLRGFKKRCAVLSDHIWAVSNFTRDKLVNNNSLEPGKIKLFPNTIGHGFKYPEIFKKPGSLLSRFGLNAQNKILLSITRISSAEAYKGYDILIRLMPELLKAYPELVYIIGGKYDEKEFSRVTAIIKKNGLESAVKLTGFIPEHELTDYYILADVFVLPSRKEGFGIVLIEAAACGTRVMAGNEDGSVDALLNGELGRAVNPTDDVEIVKAVLEELESGALTDEEKKANQELVKKNFGFDIFKSNLEKYLGDVRS
jgi:phosphatidylinositol alpha-1,6-mannosyltransferase